jgi:hypothetical protein
MAKELVAETEQASVLEHSPNPYPFQPHSSPFIVPAAATGPHTQAAAQVGYPLPSEFPASLNGSLLHKTPARARQTVRAELASRQVEGRTSSKQEHLLASVEDVRSVEQVVNAQFQSDTFLMLEPNAKDHQVQPGQQLAISRPGMDPYVHKG